jgi:hypothetical protein
VVSMLASGTQVYRFKPGLSCRIFSGEKNPQHAFLRRESKAVCPMTQICGMLSRIVWQNLTGHFSPILPRGLSLRLVWSASGDEWCTKRGLKVGCCGSVYVFQLSAQLDNITHQTITTSAHRPQLDNITHQTTTTSAHRPQLDNITHGTTTTSAHSPPTLTVYDKQHNLFRLQVTHKDIRSSLKMAHGCRNM